MNDPNSRWLFLNGSWLDIGTSMYNEDGSWMIHVYVTAAAKGEKGLEIELLQAPPRKDGIEIPEVSSTRAR